MTCFFLTEDGGRLRFEDETGRLIIENCEDIGWLPHTVRVPHTPKSPRTIITHRLGEKYVEPETQEQQPLRESPQRKPKSKLPPVVYDDRAEIQAKLEAERQALAKLYRIQQEEMLREQQAILDDEEAILAILYAMPQML